MGQGYATPQRQMIEHTNMFQTPAIANQSAQRPHATPTTSKDLAKRRCFNCEEKGHYAHMCAEPRSHTNQTPTTNPSSNRGANSIPVTARKNLTRGRVNQVARVEAQDTPMNGTFLANFISVLTIP
jgi:hypothetical protein